MLVTVSSDSSLRIWNFETMKCEVVHAFKNDEPQSVAIHSSGSWCGVVWCGVIKCCVVKSSFMDLLILLLDISEISFSFILLS